MIRDYFTHEDGKLSIVTDSGIWEYPDDGYLDFDTVEIPVRLEANWGSIYSLVNQAVLYDIRVDYHGVGAGKFVVELYINDETTPYHTLSYPVTSNLMKWRKLPPRGVIRSLRIKIETEGVVEEFEISKILIGLVRRASTGNR